MTRENSDNDRNLNETVAQPDASNETIAQSRANFDSLNETIVGARPFDAEAIAAPQRANSLLIKIKDATSYSQISEVCLYYENNWTPERKFSIQDALNYLPPDLRREAFKELVCIDISLGVSNKSSIAIPKYKAEFPSWTKEIDEAYQAAMSDSAVRYQSRIGRKLGNLRLEEMIGKGGMGVVYKAFNELLQRYEAVKYLAPTNVGQEQSLDFIRLELATNGQVKDPRFARAYDAGTDGHFYYLAMEYVDGVDLAKYLRNERGDREKSGPIPLEEAARYVCEVAKGLVSIHRKGIIHRDIKPENIMLDEDGEIRVLDLGLAKWNRSEDDAKNVDVNDAIVGTPAYMSPEAFSAPELVDERSDIYCLGGVFFFLVTGKHPVKRFNPRVDLSPKPLGEFFPGFEQNTRRSRSGARFAPGDSIRDKFLRVLEKMLEPDRDKRYKSAIKVVDDLEKVLAETRAAGIESAFEIEGDGVIDSESVSLASVVYDESKGVGESLVSIGAGGWDDDEYDDPYVGLITSVDDHNFDDPADDPFVSNFDDPADDPFGFNSDEISDQNLSGFEDFRSDEISKESPFGSNIENKSKIGTKHESKGFFNNLLKRLFKKEGEIELARKSPSLFARLLNFIQRNILRIDREVSLESVAPKKLRVSRKVVILSTLIAASIILGLTLSAFIRTKLTFNVGNWKSGVAIYALRGGGPCGEHLVIPSWSIYGYSVQKVIKICSGAFFQSYRRLTPNELPYIILDRYSHFGYDRLFGLESKSITVPAGITEIDDGAFFGCRSLSEIKVNWKNPSYRSIDGVLFSKDGKKLVAYPAGKGEKEYIVPESVEEIGRYAFSLCGSLERIEVSEKNLRYRSIDGVLFSKDGKKLVAYPAGKGNPQYVVPENVEEIEVGAFCNCHPLTSITLPERMTTIGDIAFCGCSSLTSITLPERMTTIGVGAFVGCSSLKSITLSEGITTIGDYSFVDCSSLIWITLPKRLTTIGRGAFLRCSTLMSITMPERLTTIGESAFYGCKSLRSITLSKRLTTIGESAFYGCESLKSITLPRSVETIGEDAFPREADIVRESERPAPDSEKEIKLPESERGPSVAFRAQPCEGGAEITGFDGSFSGEELIIPGTVFIKNASGEEIETPVVRIGNGAFGRCLSLKSVVLPEGITQIGNWTFYGCYSLSSVTIPEGVIQIGDNSFRGCDSLKTITLPKSVATIGKNAFPPGTEIIRDGKVVQLTPPENTREEEVAQATPRGSISKEEATRQTSVESLSIVNFRAQPCEGGAEILGIDKDYSEERLVIPATILVKDDSGEEKETRVVRIGVRAFQNSDWLKSITLPEGLTQIGANAFRGCNSLTSIVLPSGLTVIEHHAFYNCSSLASLTFPKELTTIGDNAFSGCDSLEPITLPKSVMQVGKDAFSETTKVVREGE